MLCGCGNKMNDCKCFAPRTCKPCKGFGYTYHTVFGWGGAIKKICQYCKGDGKIVPKTIGN